MAERRRFRVVEGTSVRLANKPADPKWSEFRDFRPGESVVEGEYPPYTDVAGWLASGHWVEVTADG